MSCTYYNHNKSKRLVISQVEFRHLSTDVQYCVQTEERHSISVDLCVVKVYILVVAGLSSGFLKRGVRVYTISRDDFSVVLQLNKFSQIAGVHSTTSFPYPRGWA